MTDKNVIRDEILEEISGGRRKSTDPPYEVGDFVVPSSELANHFVAYEITEPGIRLSKGYRHSVIYDGGDRYLDYRKVFVEDIQSNLKKVKRPGWIPE